MSWRGKGGVAKSDSFNNVNVNAIVANTLTLKDYYYGNFDILGNIKATGSIEVQSNIISNYVAAENLFANTSLKVLKSSTVFGNSAVKNDFYTYNRMILGNIDVSGHILTFVQNDNIGNYLINQAKITNKREGITEQYLVGKIGFNTTEPEAALDILSDLSHTLNVKSNLPQNYNTIARNMEDTGVVAYTDNVSASVRFFNEGFVSDIHRPDAQIEYMEGGNLHVDTSNNMLVHSKMIITNRGDENHVLDETLVVFDPSNSAPLLYDIYENEQSFGGHALSLVARDTNSGVVMSMVTPDKKGFTMIGGAYVPDPIRSMGAFGTMDGNGIYNPAMTMITSDNHMFSKNTIGINTSFPKTDNDRILDINGPTFIRSGETGLLIHVDFEVLNFSVSKRAPNYSIALGTPYTLEGDADTVRNILDGSGNIIVSYNLNYQQKLYFSNNFGKTWFQSNFNNTDIGFTFNIFKGVYAYDASLSFVGAKFGYMFFTNDGGQNWNGVDLNFTAAKGMEIIAIYATPIPNDPFRLRIVLVGTSPASEFGVSIIYWFDHSISELYSISTGILPDTTRNGYTLFEPNIIATNAVGTANYLYAIANAKVRKYNLFDNFEQFTPLEMIQDYTNTNFAALTDIHAFDDNFVLLSAQAVELNIDASGDIFETYIGVLVYTITGGNIVNNVSWVELIYDDLSQTNLYLKDIKLNTVFVFDNQRSIAAGYNTSAQRSVILYSVDTFQTWTELSSELLRETSAPDSILTSSTISNVFMPTSNTIQFVNVQTSYDYDANQRGFTSIFNAYLPSVFTPESNFVLNVSGGIMVNGNVEIDYDIVVRNDAILNNIIVPGNAEINNIIITGESELGNLVLTGIASFPDGFVADASAIIQQLIVVGNSDLMDLTVSGNATLLNASVQDYVEIAGNLFVNTQASVNSLNVNVIANLNELNVINNTITNSLTSNTIVFSNSVLATYLEASSNILTYDILVQNNANVNNIKSIGVANLNELQARNSVLDRLFVNQDSSMNQLRVYNHAWFKDITASGNTLLNELQVTGNSRLYKLFVSDDSVVNDVYSNNISNAQTITSDFTNTNHLTAYVDASANYLYVSTTSDLYDLNVSGNTHVVDTFSSGNTIINQNLDVLQTTNLNILNVGGVSTMTDDVFINANVQITGDTTTIDNMLYVKDISGQNQSDFNKVYVSGEFIGENLTIRHVLDTDELNATSIVRTDDFLSTGDASANNFYATTATAYNLYADNSATVSNLLVYNNSVLENIFVNTFAILPDTDVIGNLTVEGQTQTGSAVVDTSMTTVDLIVTNHSDFNTSNTTGLAMFALSQTQDAEIQRLIVPVDASMQYAFVHNSETVDASINTLRVLDKLNVYGNVDVSYNTRVYGTTTTQSLVSLVDASLNSLVVPTTGYIQDLSSIVGDIITLRSSDISTNTLYSTTSQTINQTVHQDLFVQNDISANNLVKTFNFNVVGMETVNVSKIADLSAVSLRVTGITHMENKLNAFDASFAHLDVVDASFDNVKINQTLDVRDIQTSGNIQTAGTIDVASNVYAANLSAVGDVSSNIVRANTANLSTINVSDTINTNLLYGNVSSFNTINVGTANFTNLNATNIQSNTAVFQDISINGITKINELFTIDDLTTNTVTTGATQTATLAVSAGTALHDTNISGNLVVATGNVSVSTKATIATLEATTLLSSIGTIVGDLSAANLFAASTLSTVTINSTGLATFNNVHVTGNFLYDQETMQTQTVLKDTEISGNLVVRANGSAKFLSDVSVNGLFQTVNNAIFRQGATFLGDGSFNAGVSVDGMTKMADVSVNNILYANKISSNAPQITFIKDASFGNIAIGNQLNSLDLAVFKDLSANGNTRIQNLISTYDASFNGNLKLAPNAYLGRDYYQMRNSTQFVSTTTIDFTGYNTTQYITVSFWLNVLSGYSGSAGDVLLNTIVGTETSGLLDYRSTSQTLRITKSNPARTIPINRNQLTLYTMVIPIGLISPTDTRSCKVYINSQTEPILTFQNTTVLLSNSFTTFQYGPIPNFADQIWFRDFRVYSRELTSSEIIGLYSDTLTLISPIYRDINMPFNNLVTRAYTNLVVSTDSTVNKNFYVLGDASINNVNVVGNTQLNKLHVLNDTSLNKVDVIGNATFHQNATVDGSLNVLGNTITKAINATERVSMQKGLTLWMDASMNGMLAVQGDAIFKQKVEVSGDVSLNNLFVNGTARFNNVTTASATNGDGLFNGILNVTGDASLNQRLNVGGNVNAFGVNTIDGARIGGAIAIVGDISANQKMVVGGDVSFNQKLVIGGDTSMNTLWVSGQSNLRNGLIVNGDTFFNANISTAGNANVSNNLMVSGNTFMIGNVVVVGSQTTIQNNAAVNGNLISGNLIVSGNAIMQGNVFAKDVSLNGTLVHVGNATLGNTTSTGNVIAMGATTLRNQLDVWENTTLQRNVVIGDNAPYYKFNASNSRISTSECNFSALAIGSYITITMWVYISSAWKTGGGSATANANVLGSIDMGEGVTGNYRPILVWNNDINFRCLKLAENTNQIQIEFDRFNLIALKLPVCDPDTTTIPTSTVFANVYPINPANNLSYNLATTTAATSSANLARFITKRNMRFRLGGSFSQPNGIFIRDFRIFNSNVPNSELLNQYWGVASPSAQPSLFCKLLPLNDISRNVPDGTTYNEISNLADVAVIDMSVSYVYATTVEIVADTYSRGNVDINKNMVVGGNVNVSGIATFTAPLSLNNQLTVNDKLVVMDDASLNQNLFVNGNFTLQQNATLNANATVFGNFTNLGNSSISQNLYVLGNTEVKKQLDVSGNFNTDGSANIAGNMSISKNLVALGDATIYGNLTAIKNISATRTVSAKDAVLSGNLQTSGNVVLEKRLDVSGNISTESSVSILGMLSLGGAAMIGGDISANGNIDVSGNLVAGNIQSVRDIISNGSLSVAGNTLMNGNLSLVQGSNALVDGTLTVNNDVTVNRIIINSDLSLNGVFRFAGAISYDSVNVTNDISVNRFLRVGNTATFNKSINVLGDISSNGNTDVSGNLAVHTNMSVAKDVSLNRDLYVSKDSVFNGKMKVFGDASFNKLDVGEMVNLKNELTLLGNLYGGNISLTGRADFTTGLKVNGLVECAQNLNVAGNAFYTNNITHNGTNTSITFNDTTGSFIIKSQTVVDNSFNAKSLNVDTSGVIQGNLNVKGNLVVGATTTFNSDLSSNGNLTLFKNLIQTSNAVNNVLGSTLFTNDVSLNGSLVLGDNTVVPQTTLRKLNTFVSPSDTSITWINQGVFNAGINIPAGQTLNFAGTSLFARTNVWTGDNSFNNLTVSASNLLTLNGNLRVVNAGTNVDITPSELSFVKGATSSLQTQISALPTFAGTNTWTGVNTFNDDIVLAATKKLTLNGNLSVGTSTITPTELGYLTGLSVNVQTQFTNINSNISTLTSTVNELPTKPGSNEWTGLNTFTAGLVIPATKTITIQGTLTVGNSSITSTELSSLSGITGNIQSQLNNITTTANTQASTLSTLSTTVAGLPTFAGNNTWTGTTNTFNSDVVISASKLLTLTGNLRVVNVGTNFDITPSELSYVKGATSNLQTQISALPTFAGTNAWTGVNTFSNDMVMSGASKRLTFSNPTNGEQQIRLYSSGTNIIGLGVDGTSTGPSIMTLVNTVNGGTIKFSIGANEPVIITSNGLTLQGNLRVDNVNVSPSTLKYIFGVSSNIQDQLDTKASPSSNNTWTGTNTWAGTNTWSGPNTWTGTTTFNTTVNIGTAGSAVNRELNVNGILTTVDAVIGRNTSDLLTVNSNISAGGQTITPTQLGYLSGAKSNLQNQIDNFQASNIGTMSDNIWKGENTFENTVYFGDNMSSEFYSFDGTPNNLLCILQNGGNISFDKSVVRKKVIHNPDNIISNGYFVSGSYAVNSDITNLSSIDNWTITVSNSVKMKISVIDSNAGESNPFPNQITRVFKTRFVNVVSTDSVNTILRNRTNFFKPGTYTLSFRYRASVSSSITLKCDYLSLGVTSSVIAGSSWATATIQDINISEPTVDDLIFTISNRPVGIAEGSIYITGITLTAVSPRPIDYIDMNVNYTSRVYSVAELVLSNSPFTIEWIQSYEEYPTSETNILFELTDTTMTDTELSFGFTSLSTAYLQVGETMYDIELIYALVVNQVYHFAICKDYDCVIRVYLNGQQIFDELNDTPINDDDTSTSRNFYIGRNFVGLISNFTYLYGAALSNSSTYEIPSSTYTITDTANAAISRNNVIGYYKFNGIQNGFPGSSIFNDIGNSVYTIENHSDLQFGMGAFTIEWWQYQTTSAPPADSTNDARVFTMGKYSNAMIGVVQQSATTDPSLPSTASYLFIYDISEFSNIGLAETVISDTENYFNTRGNGWNHFAISRSGTTIRYYINGVLISSSSNSVNYNSSEILTIGGEEGDNTKFIGYITGFTWIKGADLYPNGTPFVPRLTQITSVPAGATLALSICGSSILGTLSAFVINNSVTTTTEMTPYGEVNLALAFPTVDSALVSSPASSMALDGLDTEVSAGIHISDNTKHMSFYNPNKMHVILPGFNTPTGSFSFAGWVRINSNDRTLFSAYSSVSNKSYLDDDVNNANTYTDSIELYQNGQSTWLRVIATNWSFHPRLVIHEVVANELFTDTFVHLAVCINATYNGKCTVSAYVNGNKVFNKINLDAPNPIYRPYVNLGKGNTRGDFFDGGMYDVMIANRAFTELEVQTMYLNPGANNLLNIRTQTLTASPSISYTLPGSESTLPTAQMYYKLNGTDFVSSEPKLINSSTNVADATRYNNPLFGTFSIYKELKLVGQLLQNIELPSITYSTSANRGLTFACWFRYSSIANDYSRLVSLTDSASGYRIRIGFNPTHVLSGVIVGPGGYTFGDQVFSQIPMNDNTYRHFAFVLKHNSSQSCNIYVYLNTVEIFKRENVIHPKLTGSVLNSNFIGYGNVPLENTYFNGGMFDVVLDTRPFAQSDIQTLFINVGNGCAPSPSANVISYYKLDGTDIVDSYRLNNYASGVAVKDAYFNIVPATSTVELNNNITPVYGMYLDNYTLTRDPTGRMNGTYICTASSIYQEYRPYYAFASPGREPDGGSETFWHSDVALYNPLPYIGYFGTTYSTVVGETVIYGEWIQIQTPTEYLITGYKIKNRYYGGLFPDRYVRDFWLVGSDDGETWIVINNQTNRTEHIVKVSLTNDNHNAYTYFRFVFTSLNGGNYININQIDLYTKGTSVIKETMLIPTALGLQFITLPTIPFPANEFSFACWFRAEITASNSRIFDIGIGGGTGILAAVVGNVLTVSSFLGGSPGSPADTYILSNFPVNDNIYRHFAFTLTNISSTQSRLIIYLNGNMVANVIRPYALSAATYTSNFIGKNNVVGTIGEVFTGGMFDVLMLSRALTQNEVVLLKNNPNHPNLLSLFNKTSQNISPKILISASPESNIVGTSSSLNVPLTEIDGLTDVVKINRQKYTFNTRAILYGISSSTYRSSGGSFFVPYYSEVGELNEKNIFTTGTRFVNTPNHIKQLSTMSLLLASSTFRTLLYQKSAVALTDSNVSDLMRLTPSASEHYKFRLDNAVSETYGTIVFGSGTSAQTIPASFILETESVDQLHNLLISEYQNQFVSSNGIAGSHIMVFGLTTLVSINDAPAYISPTGEINTRSHVSAGSLISSSTVTAYNFNALSDRRLKTNIQPISPQLEKIKALQPCEFDWKTTGKHDMGFIAQEVFKMYPVLSPGNTENDDEEGSIPVYHGMDYGKLTTCLWKGLQEAVEIIDTQRTEIDELKQQMLLVLSKLG